MRFYAIMQWSVSLPTIFRMEGLDVSKIKLAMQEVFANRGSELKYPAAFTPTFYDAPETLLRWKNFLSAMGKDHIEFKEIIEEISVQIKPLIAMSGNQ